MRSLLAVFLVTACASPTQRGAPPRAPEPVPTAVEPGASATPVPAPVPTREASSPRDTRKSSTTPRSRTLLVSKIHSLQRLLQATPRKAPERPLLVHRLAEAYVELRYAAERDSADSEVASSRRRALELYSVLVREYPNYERLDQVLYYAGYEQELAGALSQARALYRALAQKFPSSEFLARVPAELLPAR